MKTETALPALAPSESPWLDIVRKKVGAIRYGAVNIVIHDGKITQIESTEKTRFQEAAPARAQS